MHKSKGSKHNLMVDRQKAKEFLTKREAIRAKRVGLTNVRGTENVTSLDITGRKMENGNV